MEKKKKNLLLLVVAGVLLAGAAVLAFQDSILTGKDSTSAEVRAVVDDAARNAEPPAPEPPKSNFHKQAKQVGGN